MTTLPNHNNLKHHTNPLQLDARDMHTLADVMTPHVIASHAPSPPRLRPRRIHQVTLPLHRRPRIPRARPIPRRPRPLRARPLQQRLQRARDRHMDTSGHDAGHPLSRAVAHPRTHNRTHHLQHMLELRHVHPP